jgi:glycosyltransferase involved in cell wall biosynthesis
MLFFGYVRAYKGLAVLLEAMKNLAGEFLDDALLLVVGEFYDDEASYRRKVRELGVEEKVRFVSHYVPSSEVAPYFSAADVVVLPYVSATQSGIIQIAYNFDRPVIATDVGGLAEVVRDGLTGFIVPPSDPGSLSGAVQRFYHENREREFSANVKVEKKKYSWDRLVDAVEELSR